MMMAQTSGKASLGNPFIDREDVLAEIRAAFSGRDPQYSDLRKKLKDRLGPLQEKVEALQATGHAMVCSEQILLEAQWLVNYRDDWSRAAQRIDAAETSIGNIDQPGPTQDDDGSWGRCCEEWYRKLEPTVDALQASDLDLSHVKPLTFMKRLEDPQKTLDYLYRLQISDIEATGRNNRDELGAVQSALSQLIFKDELRDLFGETDLDFAISAELEDVYVDYLRQTQHPRTGYWGPWYRFGDRLVMVQDLSFTFHVIQYRSGNIENWPVVIDTTFAIKDLVYPAGWKPNADTQYSNHNNYDVLTLLFFGWPHMSADQKHQARQEILAMLTWCLTKSVRGDGFQMAGDSAVDSYYFGVRFLDRAGFWDAAKRFWARKQPVLPPEAPTPVELCQRLQRGFAKLNDASEEGATVRSLLRAAQCASGNASS
jgi:hypothetical protein